MKKKRNKKTICLIYILYKLLTKGSISSYDLKTKLGLSIYNICNYKKEINQTIQDNNLEKEIGLMTYSYSKRKYIMKK